MPKGQPTSPEKISEIQRLRASGLTPEQVAARLGVEAKIVSRYSMQRLTRVNREMLEQLAKYTGPIEFAAIALNGIPANRAIVSLHALRKAGYVTFVQTANGSDGVHHISIKRIEITSRGRDLIHAEQALPKLPQPMPDGHAILMNPRDHAVRHAEVQTGLGDQRRDELSPVGMTATIVRDALIDAPSERQIRPLPHEVLDGPQEAPKLHEAVQLELERRFADHPPVFEEAQAVIDAGDAEQILMDEAEASVAIDLNGAAGRTMKPSEADERRRAAEAAAVSYSFADRTEPQWPWLTMLETKRAAYTKAKRVQALLEEAASLSDDEMGVELLEKAEQTVLAVALSPVEIEYLEFAEWHR